MRDIYIKELHLLVGLPGSGKTTYAQKELQKIRPYNSAMYGSFSESSIQNGIVNFDYIYNSVIRNGRQKVSLMNTDLELRRYKVKEMALPNRVPENKILVLDGLFTTQEEYEWILSLYMDKEGRSYKIDKIIVDYWIPDIESCLWNDMGRRTVHSEESIKNLKIEKPDIKKIQEKFGITTKLSIHSVVRKPKYLNLASKYGIRDTDIHSGQYLYSNTWSLGGKYHSYTGDVHYLSAEEPCNFDAFDDLLSEICPTITFLQYKKLYNRCVTMDDRDNSDYYSEAREGFYKCDLEMLFDMLEEMGILKE